MKHVFPIFWLTGNTGAGKSTVTSAVEKYFNEEPDAPDPLARKLIVLDGDEMRATISEGEDLSAEGRRAHNLRVARLAKLLKQKGFLVLVSVIAPFAKVRGELDEICQPKWVYIKRETGEDESKPYEAPENPDLVLDHDSVGPGESAQRLIELIKESLDPTDN